MDTVSERIAGGGEKVCCWFVDSAVDVRGRNWQISRCGVHMKVAVEKECSGHWPDLDCNS